jgi:autotransporter-associated beta strand protein
MSRKSFILNGLLVASLFTATAASAGGNVCVTIASGNWSDPIWDCGGSNTTPSVVDDVTIRSPHTVLLNQDVTINTLFVEVGGDFNVGPSSGVFELEVEQSGSDLSNTTIDLFGDFRIRANVPGVVNVDITIGSVDGGFDLSIFSDDDITILGDIGANTPLTSYEHSSLREITLTGSITTTGDIRLDGETRIAGPVVLAGQNIFLVETVDADILATDRTLTMLATQEVHWDSTVIGGTVPLHALTVTAPLSMNVAGNAATTDEQIYNVAVTLNADTTFSGASLQFNSTVDLQSFDLRLNGGDAALEGAVSGTGSLISDLGVVLDVNENNTYTGQTLIRSGILNLQTTPNNNAIANSALISLANDTALTPNALSDTFELQGGQTLSGTGEVQGALSALAGSVLRPGDNLGSGLGGLTAPTVLLTGTKLAVQLQGNGRGSDFDRLIVDTLTIDSSAMLDVEVISTPLPGEQFSIIDVAASLTGIFNALPEGAILAAQDGSRFRISYAGGDGNDVVLEYCADLSGVDSTAGAGSGSHRQAIAGAASGCGPIFRDRFEGSN